MKLLFRILTVVLLLPTIYFVFIFGGIPLAEGYNTFNPYIDTEFAKDYTPSKFDLITTDLSKNELEKIIGIPLRIHVDSAKNEVEYVYTNDGYLSKKSKSRFIINDFAWYRSSVTLNESGKVIRINKGWSYD